MREFLKNKNVRRLLWGAAFVLVMWWAIREDVQILVLREPHEMTELCKTAGAHIYEQVEDVRSFAILSGVFVYPPDTGAKVLEQVIAGENPDSTPPQAGCFPCLQELVVDQYDAVESYYTEPLHGGAGSYGRLGMYVDYTDRTGLYRYSLRDRDQDQEACRPFDELIAFGEKNRGDYWKLALHIRVFLKEYDRLKDALGNRCIVAEPITEFTAPYRVVTGIQKRFRPKTFFGGMHEIIHTNSYVIRQSDQKMLAEANFFSYLFAHLGGTRARCGDYDLPPMTSVLKPAKTLDQK